jgi:hypothetical protein
MTPSEAARIIGRLGGRKKNAKLTAEHRNAIRIGMLRHYRDADAARVAAVCDTERGAMLAARRTIDDHAPRALTQDGAARKSARSTAGDRP